MADCEFDDVKCTAFDRFQDSFMRICGDIRTEGGLSGNYEYELAVELKKAFKVAYKEVL